MRYIFYLFALTLVSCSTVPETETMLFGKWNYSKVIQGDSSIMEISQGDKMELFVDYLFTYNIVKENQYEEGRWRMYGDTIKLTYKPVDKVRNFIIKELTTENLTLQEGEVYYHFNKVN